LFPSSGGSCGCFRLNRLTLSVRRCRSPPLDVYCCSCCGGGNFFVNGASLCCCNCFAAANSFFFCSMRVRGIPDGLVCASKSKVQTSLQNRFAPSSPRNPTKSNCACFGSGDTAAATPSTSSGRNKFTTVDVTISSSKPNRVVMVCSIHWTITGRLIWESWIVLV